MSAPVCIECARRTQRDVAEGVLLIRVTVVALGALALAYVFAPVHVVQVASTLLSVGYLILSGLFLRRTNYHAMRMRELTEEMRAENQRLRDALARDLTPEDSAAEERHN